MSWHIETHAKSPFSLSGHPILWNTCWPWGKEHEYAIVLIPQSSTPKTHAHTHSPVIAPDKKWGIVSKKKKWWTSGICSACCLCLGGYHIWPYAIMNAIGNAISKSISNFVLLIFRKIPYQCYIHLRLKWEGIESSGSVRTGYVS